MNGQYYRTYNSTYFERKLTVFMTFFSVFFSLYIFCLPHIHPCTSPPCSAALPTALMRHNSGTRLTHSIHNTHKIMEILLLFAYFTFINSVHNYILKKKIFIKKIFSFFVLFCKKFSILKQPISIGAKSSRIKK